MFGPRLLPDGGAVFRLWAPGARDVVLSADRDHAMQSLPSGWRQAFVPEARPGLRYAFRVDGREVPDPASHFQPDDTHGRSELIDHDYPWRCEAWTGRPWQEAAILELHVGTFTPEGTFRAAVERLDHVRNTGFTAIELMPVAEFPGRRNWGYDGVLLFAPDSAYGRPEDLKALVDAAHKRDLMVFLDVVYNHFGPEGNYLAAYAPRFFASEVQTPWGAAIDYSVPEVRAFAIENALHWLSRYRFDGLRLDAVHAIRKPGAPPVLEELSRAVSAFAASAGRRIHLVLENDDNVARLLDDGSPAAGKYRAQWNDDYHHAWHVCLTGETGGYYADYAEAPAALIARALAQGFVYQGEASCHREGRARGEPSTHLPPTAFVNFLQNHDQIGNRALGERLTRLCEAPAIEAALAVTLLAPSPPLMFMGEEWGTARPFPFFCDFTGDLAEAVRTGRAAEFAAQFAAHGDAGTVPDPLVESTVRSATLDWSEPERDPFRRRLQLVRTLLHIRQARIVPLIATMGERDAISSFCEGLLTARWTFDDGTLALAANLSSRPIRRTAGPAHAEWLWGERDAELMQPWAVDWWLEPS
ncbi:MAG: malto-oligosyltrehalose trehalohydrolase [Variibacter sp.]|nr:malto-oligosyltrehalose trehalohydrolase [Variibacter sp.]